MDRIEGVLWKKRLLLNWLDQRQNLPLLLILRVHGLNSLIVVVLEYRLVGLNRWGRRNYVTDVKALCFELITLILDPLVIIEQKLRHARNILKEWATYSNGTETQTHTKTAPRNHKSRNDNDTVDAQDWIDLNAGVLVVSPTDAQKISDNAEI